MSHIAIHAENLGKHFLCGHQRERIDLRQILTDFTRSLFRVLPLASRDYHTNFRSLQSKRGMWVLRHVSFDLAQGDTVGIIGNNGGGKTTLLGMFSRIIYPTEGYAEIQGQVATLLDLGAGFHGELTGREKIRLGSAIRGMTKGEINRKFDAIVGFAELERFVDTRLKYYSSGMCARLAFALAAHQESEVLLVDEVLAPGDNAFQKKCLEKLKNAAGEGRTVVFVSHDLEYVRQLCRYGIVLAAGRAAYVGPADEAVDHYSSISLPQFPNTKPVLAEILKEG